MSPSPPNYRCFLRQRNSLGYKDDIAGLDFQGKCVHAKGKSRFNLAHSKCKHGLHHCH